MLLKAAAGGLVAAALPAEQARANVPWVQAGRFLDAMTDVHDGDGPRLPQSYSDQVGLMSTAFTYDAALAILAYLVLGDLRRARAIGDGLLHARTHDPEWGTGPLRQAYAAGPYRRGERGWDHGFTGPDGTVDAGGPFRFTAAYTGDQAWAGLALLALHRRTRDQRYLEGATALAAWVRDEAASPGPLGGYTLGRNRQGAPTTAQSTVHNADLYTLFSRLNWTKEQDNARRFVERAWIVGDEECCFSAGSPDGETRDDGARTLEAQTHPWLALRDERHRGALAFVDCRLRVADTPDAPNSALTGRQHYRGITVSTGSPEADPGRPIEEGLPAPDPQAVWFEGTAQYAVALRAAGEPRRALRERDPITDAQTELGTGQTAAGRALPERSGVVAASSPLHVGFADSGYYPSRHVAATAWHVLSIKGVNPLS
ncbi:Tat pathway signal sequence domain protein [Catenuloplanes japonicus]|uniref:Tat pathway signal sequence domain protein n=1 Tax=Catenuloplanes japonicus TaxID=33876 RepID=UPI0012FBD980|nr:Tat pathway signal sequence domain protein [Catenuloplanes japonicus]